jgi:hypothetical protein
MPSTSNSGRRPGIRTAHNQRTYTSWLHISRGIPRQAGVSSPTRRTPIGRAFRLSRSATRGDSRAASEFASFALPHDIEGAARKLRATLPTGLSREERASNCACWAMTPGGHGRSDLDRCARRSEQTEVFSFIAEREEIERPVTPLSQNPGRCQRSPWHGRLHAETP